MPWSTSGAVFVVGAIVFGRFSATTDDARERETKKSRRKFRHALGARKLRTFATRGRLPVVRPRPPSRRPHAVVCGGATAGGGRKVMLFLLLLKRERSLSSLSILTNR